MREALEEHECRAGGAAFADAFGGVREGVFFFRFRQVNLACSPAFGKQSTTVARLPPDSSMRRTTAAP